MGTSIPLMILICGAVPVGGPATAGDKGEALRTLIESERAFASLSVRSGVDSAFLFYLADDAVILRPHPENGKAWISGHPAPSITLSWQPDFGAVSAAGDLGYTTGPWTVTGKGEQQRPLSFGSFVSVWRRQLDRQWKVVFDMGITHPRGLVVGQDSTRHPSDGEEVVPWGSITPASRAVAEVRRTDSVLSFTARSGGYFATMSGALMPGARVYRDGHHPATTRDSVNALFRLRQGIMEWKPIGVGAASSGDLAYSYGSYIARKEGTAPERGYYMRVWRRGNDAPWMIALDIESSLPPE